MLIRRIFDRRYITIKDGKLKVYNDFSFPKCVYLKDISKVSIDSGLIGKSKINTKQGKTLFFNSDYLSESNLQKLLSIIPSNDSSL